MAKLKKRLLVWCFIVSIVLFLNVNLAHAQSIHYGKLTGRVMLPSGETVPGAAVIITSDALVSGKRTTVTSEKGTFVFLNLPVGKYKVTTTLEGFKTVIQENIVISAAAVAKIDLVTELGKIEQKIVVTAAGPVIDVKTSTVDTKIQKEMLDKLPTSRDAFYDLSLITPGMFDVGMESSWLPSPTAYGGATNENIFLVNGVNTTNPRGGAWGSLVNVNYSTVEEVRVIALGSKAEYGSFSGVAIDVLTKSGSNKIQGNIGFFSKIGTSRNNQPTGSLGGNWLAIKAGDDVYKDPVKDLEFSLTLGGPLVKNKLWFYGGFNFIDYRTKVPFFDPHKTYKGRYFDFKLTGEAGNNLRAWVAYHFESNDNLNESWGTLGWDSEVVYDTNKKTHSLSAQLQWILGGTTSFTAKYLGFWSDQDSSLPDNAPDYPAYINWWKWIPKDMGVNGSFHAVEAEVSSRHTVQADLSYYAEDFIGEHDMKFGVQYTKGKGNWFGGWFHGYANYAYPYRWTQNVGYMQSWYGDTGFEMYVRQPHQDPYLTVRTSDSLGLFFDDQWTIGNRLTINLGVRYDRMTSKFGEGKVYNQPSDPSKINEASVSRTRKGSDNVFDFNTFSPRIGLSYMITKDAKTVLRASYGRYYSPISVENLGSGGPDMDPVNTQMLRYSLPFNQVDVNGDNYISGEEVFIASRLLHGATPYTSWWDEDDPSYVIRINDDLKNQFTDQFTVSLERELFKDFSVSATYIHKETKNLIVRWPIDKVTGNDWFNFTQRASYTTESGVNIKLYKVPFIDFNGDGSINGDDIDYFFTGGNFEWRNMPEIDGKKARRFYQGLQFVLKKRYSNRWQMMASFLYSKTDGMAARNKRQDQDLNMEGPNIIGDAWLGDFNQVLNNMEGPLPFTPKFELKFNASYRIPVVEVDLGVRFRYSSGRPMWKVEGIDTSQLEGTQRFSWDVWTDPSEFGPGDYLFCTDEPQILSTDVNDPFYLPSRKILDLHIERSFKLGPGSINVVLDFFNVFNDGTVTNALPRGESFGRVTGITFPPQQIRLSLLYEF